MTARCGSCKSNVKTIMGPFISSEIPPRLFLISFHARSLPSNLLHDVLPQKAEADLGQEAFMVRPYSSLRFSTLLRMWPFRAHLLRRSFFPLGDRADLIRSMQSFSSNHFPFLIRGFPLRGDVRLIRFSFLSYSRSVIWAYTSVFSLSL